MRRPEPLAAYWVGKFNPLAAPEMVDPADVKLLKGCSSRGRGQEAETELPGAAWAWDVD